jgi:hypothetical protein
MAGRGSTAKEQRVSRREGLRTFVVVLAITCVPVLGAVLAIVSTTEPDLSDLAPIHQPQVRQPQSGYVLLDWLTLRDGRFSPDASVQALGYMLESDHPLHTGDSIRDFVLLPEAGNLLHPAHRITDQMIVVHLRAGEQIQFSPRSLVWAWGIFRAAPGGPSYLQPIYHLDQAQAKHADKSEISKYFR